MKDFFALVLKFIRFFFTSLLGLFIGLNSQIFVLLTKNNSILFFLIFTLLTTVYIILKNMIEF